MAFSFDPGGEDSPLADINVTPLVDVMLVLLIIFMVTAPMLHQGIEVALPRADAKNLPPRVDDPLIISINRDGMVFLRDAPVHASLLMERLTPMLKSRGDDSVYLKGDRDVPYGVVVEVLDILHRGGVEHVGMVTEKPSGAGAKPVRR